MRNRFTVNQLLALLLLSSTVCPAFAGDSLYGRVTEVKAGNIVIFDYGAGVYELKLVGIEVPEGIVADHAKDALAGMVLGKNVRMRFDHRTEDGVMLARVFTDDPDPEIGIRDVAVEMVRRGMLRRKQGFDFKYGELTAAETEARSARRGLWAPDQPQ